MLDAGHAWTADPDGLTRKHLAERNLLTRPQPPNAQQPLAEAGRPAAAQPKPVATPVGAAHPAARPSPPAAAAKQEPGSTAPVRGRDVDLVEQWAADVWVDVGRSIDPKLVAGADWSFRDADAGPGNVLRAAQPQETVPADQRSRAHVAPMTV